MHWQCASCPAFRSKDWVAHIRVAHSHDDYNVTCGIDVCSYYFTRHKSLIHWMKV